jgi:hypothetical protein
MLSKIHDLKKIRTRLYREILTLIRLALLVYVEACQLLPSLSGYLGIAERTP